ncbi:unnamed protein product [Vitrella brassicaformis CCMP3155]|uniref:Uncharacterized protein n=1 Tax=Vitrella brassicaformis (strain CCMP3155) TaxID=1169540 RepID=A0A0G4GSW8_VITBC|nr:unnamed protein product [Vitrella brassicaformis CCMP3155]|mmetsp:Transcript_33498/g.82981  ORF Transcript_33498/g.82981 Transcript_33498/m.82981 type:complete len:220 (-) Transcript_33498:734-1393(-)|eukprot:CEM33776.1 unnamed protein product [Vitrella brassicaformis CCMP3155]
MTVECHLAAGLLLTPLKPTIFFFPKRTAAKMNKRIKTGDLEGEGSVWTSCADDAAKYDLTIDERAGSDTSSSRVTVVSVSSDSSRVTTTDVVAMLRAAGPEKALGEMSITADVDGVGREELMWGNEKDQLPEIETVRLRLYVANAGAGVGVLSSVESILTVRGIRELTIRFTTADRDIGVLREIRKEYFRRFPGGKVGSFHTCSHDTQWSLELSFRRRE